MSISTNVRLVCEWHIFLQYYTVTIGETESVFVLLKGEFVKKWCYNRDELGSWQK